MFHIVRLRDLGHSISFNITQNLKFLRSYFGILIFSLLSNSFFFSCFFFFLFLFRWYSSRLGTDQQKKDAARFVKTEKSIGTLFSVFGFFVDHEWTFDGTNLEELRNTLTEEDANEFNFDVGRIHWEMYLKFWLWGIGVHILKVCFWNL